MRSYKRRLAERAKGRHTRPATALAILGACLALAACGSSTSSTSNTGSSSPSATSTAKSPTASAKRATGPNSSQFAALRSCLSKQGIVLPSAPTGTGRPSGAAKPGAAGARPGGLQLPKGISSAKYQAALKKCGAGSLTLGGRGAAGGTPPGGVGTGGPPTGAGAPPGEGKTASTPPAFKVSGG
jgi:hypothetical protein